MSKTKLLAWVIIIYTSIALIGLKAQYSELSKIELFIDHWDKWMPLIVMMILAAYILRVR